MENGVAAKEKVSRKTAAQRLVEMVENPKRQRSNAYAQIEHLCSELAFDSDIRLTYSLVTNEGEGIIFKHDRQHRLGLYDRADQVWDTAVKCDEFWKSVMVIVKWYFAIKRKYKIGRHTTNEHE